MHDDTRQYLQVCFGNAEGWLCAAVGLKPYRDENGKYKHDKWDEVAFRWPAQADKAATYIAKAGRARRRVHVPVSDERCSTARKAMRRNGF